MCLSLICSPIELDVKLTKYLYSYLGIEDKLLSIAYFTVFPNTDETDFYKYLKAVLTEISEES